MPRFVKSEINIALFLSLVFLNLTIGALVILDSDSVSADDVVVSANAVVTVGGGCTMAATLDLAHNATIPNGTYKGDGIGQTTLKVVCNDPGGYAIYAAGYTGEEIDGTDSTKLIGVDTGEKISTGTYSAGASTSSWSMKLATSGSSFVPNIVSPYSAFSAVPSPYTKVAYLNSSTDYGMGATGSVLTATYAAYISATQAADTYNGKVIFTLVHPATNVPNEPKDCVSGKICYYPNAGNEALYTMGNQTLSATPTLWPSNFKRDGYGFAGWSDAFDWVVNEGSQSNPDAHIYGPNETLSLTTSDYPNGLSLYAVWVKPEGYLQGWTGCSSLANGNVTALIDMRDDDVYAVAKLADGNCWMIENLRLDNTATTGEVNEALAQGYGGVFSGLAEPETSNFSVTSTANSRYISDGTGSIYNDSTNPITKTDIGTGDYADYHIPRYRNDNTNSDPNAPAANKTVSNMTSVNQNIYSYGNYYNWAAAMAKTTVYYDFTPDASGFTPSEAAKISLCPIGWQLPYGRSTGKGAGTGGFYYLNYSINDESDVEDSTASLKLRSYPNNFLYSGATIGSSINSRGSFGNYWSSTGRQSTASSLHLDSDGVSGINDNHVTYEGFPIRCLVSS